MKSSRPPGNVAGMMLNPSAPPARKRASISSTIWAGSPRSANARVPRRFADRAGEGSTPPGGRGRTSTADGIWPRWPPATRAPARPGRSRRDRSRRSYAPAAPARPPDRSGPASPRIWHGPRPPCARPPEQPRHHLQVVGRAAETGHPGLQIPIERHGLVERLVGREDDLGGAGREVLARTRRAGLDENRLALRRARDVEGAADLEMLARWSSGRKPSGFENWPLARSISTASSSQVFQRPSTTSTNSSARS